MAAVVAGGGYALASTGGNEPARGNNGPSYLYLMGSSTTVGPHSNGQNATTCPRDTYPVGGGMNSSRGNWETEWSYADSSGRRSRQPDEWTVGLYNDGNSRAVSCFQRRVPMTGRVRHGGAGPGRRPRPTSWRATWTV